MSNTIIINGKVYDAASGLPVAAPEPVRITVRSSPKPKPVTYATAAVKSIDIKPVSRSHAKSAHRTTQKSATLRRDILKKPVSAAHVGTARRKPVAGHVARSSAITKFAAHPQPLQSRSHTVVPAKKTQAAHHAIVAKKHALVEKTTSAPAAQKLSSRTLKEQLIAERLANVATTPSAPVKKPKGSFFKQQRTTSVLAVSLAVMVFGGYLTYLNMPGLSVRVAAAQADVAASFPDYHPDGYRFNGPVAYAPGQVTINFAANGGSTKYTVTEQKSGWDSQAVYDNVVASAGDNNYVTNSQQGLTVYTYGNGQAAWVNKGILYTVNGDAPLTNDQLLKIAASL